MRDILLGMLKALPMNVLIDLFLDLAEDFASKSDSQVDDALVAALRGAFVPRQS